MIAEQTAAVAATIRITRLGPVDAEPRNGSLVLNVGDVHEARIAPDERDGHVALLDAVGLTLLPHLGDAWEVLG